MGNANQGLAGLLGTLRLPGDHQYVTWANAMGGEKSLLEIDHDTVNNVCIYVYMYIYLYIYIHIIINVSIHMYIICMNIIHMYIHIFYVQRGSVYIQIHCTVYNDRSHFLMILN